MLRPLRRPLAAGLLALFLIAGGALYVFSGSQTNVSLPDPRPGDRALWPGTGTWAEAVLDTLTLEEQVSQLFAVRVGDRFPRASTEEYARLADRVERFGIGAFVLSEALSEKQARRLNDLQERSALPLLVSQHQAWEGARRRVADATAFPPPLALGATRAPAFTRAVGYVKARQARARGTHQVWAPIADASDEVGDAEPSLRSFGEAPQLVADMVGASVSGLQEGRVLATTPPAPGRRSDAAQVAFRAALSAGIKSAWSTPRAGAPASEEAAPLRRLREERGFEGLVTAAPNTENTNPGEAAVRALEAGADVLLLPNALRAARDAVLRAVDEGRLREARIAESAARLLRAKDWLGLADRRTIRAESLRRQEAPPPHRALAGAVARRSLTLLRNDNDLLPLLAHLRPAAEGASPPQMLSVAMTGAPTLQKGRAFARRLGRRVPDSLLTRRVLDARADPDDYRAARTAAADADVILVSAFSAVRGGSGRAALPDRHRRLVQQLVATDTPVVFVAFGPPNLAAGLAQPPAAVLAAYGASGAAQEAALQALFGESALSGTLPVSLSEAYDYGAGLAQPQGVLRHGLPEAVGMRSRRLRRVDSLMQAAIAARAFPGAAVAIGRGPATALMSGYGTYTYDGARSVTPRSRFDLASLTKVVATTTAAMQLYEAGRLKVGARVARYLPAFAQGGKGEVTVRQLLTHSAGLPAFRPYAGMDFANPRAEGTRAALVDTLLAEAPQYPPGTKSVYSDLGMVVMGLVIEEITGQSLAAYAEEHIFEPLGMEDTGFRPVRTTAPDTAFVPTEREGFRGRLLQGEVHDPTAYLLGGVSGNAGVFSTARDLATFAYMLTHDGRIYGEQFLKAQTIERFTERAKGLGGTRALGWDTKTVDGYSSAGQHLGPNSFGHTGFTGTSLWVDPDEDLFVLLLTNRVYPERRDDPQIAAVRPQLADLAYTAIAGPPAPLLPAPKPRRSAPRAEAP